MHNIKDKWAETKNTDSMGRPPAAEDGASVFFVSAHLSFLLWISMDIPYVFLIYSIYIS